MQIFIAGLRNNIENYSLACFAHILSAEALAKAGFVPFAV